MDTPAAAMPDPKKMKLQARMHGGGHFSQTHANIYACTQVSEDLLKTITPGKDAPSWADCQTVEGWYFA